MTSKYSAAREWEEELYRPGAIDLAKMERIKATYEAALRKEKVYSALYERERAVYLANLTIARNAARAELSHLSKTALADRLTMTAEARRTYSKADLVAMVIRFKVDDAVLNEHRRVSVIWKTATTAEREGFEPMPIFEEAEVRQRAQWEAYAAGRGEKPKVAAPDDFGIEKAV